MPEPASLHMVIRDFDYQLRPQRLPGQVLSLTPAALPSRHTPSQLIRTEFLVCPMLPGMMRERIISIGAQELDEFTALLGGKARTDANMLQRTSIIKKTKQQ